MLLTINCQLNQGVSPLIEAGPGWETCPDAYRDHTPAGLTHFGYYDIPICCKLLTPNCKLEWAGIRFHP